MSNYEFELEEIWPNEEKAVVNEEKKCENICEKPVEKKVEQKDSNKCKCSKCEKGISCEVTQKNENKIFYFY